MMNHVVVAGATPDFSLSAYYTNTSAAEVNTIIVTGQNGFTGQVNLTLSYTPGLRLVQYVRFFELHPYRDQCLSVHQLKWAGELYSRGDGDTGQPFAQHIDPL